MKSKFPAIFLVIILFFVYWRWFIPELKVGNDFPSVSETVLKSFMDFPRIWSEKGSEGLGEYTVFTLWSYPNTFISGIFANLGLGFGIQERMLLLIPFLVIGGFGIWKFCRNLKLSNFARLVVAFFYLSNTYILLVVDGGQLSIALAYAWFPICFMLIENSIGKGLRQQILAGISISILGFFDIRYIYILLLTIFVRFLYELIYLGRKQWFSWLINWLKNGLTWFAIFIALNVYWLLPLFKAPLSGGVYANLTMGSFLSFITLGHPLFLLAPNWFKNIFGNITPLKWEFIFIPILVFLAPVLRPRNRIIGFWLIIALVFTFLAKGASEPLPFLYPWFFTHLPFFSLFRDSSKFFLPVALSYSILIGISVTEILGRIGGNKILKFVFLSVIICYFLFLIRPVWLGETTGTFSHPQFKDEFTQVDSILSDDKEFSRVFWIPAIRPLTNLTLQHPVLEAARVSQKRTFAIGTIGTYETFNFLREAPYMGEIFDVAGIGYIAYPYLDPRRDDIHSDNIKYYSTFLDQLSKRPWLSRVENSSIPLLKTKEHQDKFFVTLNIWWVIGSDNLYNEATKSANLKLANNALIFAEENKDIGTRIDELPEAKIVLNNKTNLDLAASFISPANLIFLAKSLGFDPDKMSGWWKRDAVDLISWRSFLQEKYKIDNQDFDLGGGWAVGEGNKKYQISNIKYQKNNILLARVLESTRSGELKFSQNGQFIGSINTKKEGNNIRWFEVGQLTQDGGELEVTSAGDINVVNALAFLDKAEWVSHQDKAKKLQERIVNFDEKNAESDNNPTVAYQKINPTKYKVIVSNLTKPSLMIFSQSYDGFWKINGVQTPLPVYSLLNGFRIQKDGEYIVEFEPQKYVYPGLVISGIMTICLSLFFLRRHLSSHK